jgi:apolipoprotein N-acyltransferase
VRLDAESDEVLSLRAEMHEELTQAWIVPTAAFVATKEGAKGMGMVGAIAIVIALAIAIPLAFVDFGSTLGVRLIVFSLVAVALGGTIGFVAGAGMGSKRPAEPMAAHSGVVLRVDQDSRALRDALADEEPIRVDEVTHDDVPLDTILTEEQAHDDGTVEEVAANLQGDDYHPQENR